MLTGMPTKAGNGATAPYMWFLIFPLLGVQQMLDRYLPEKKVYRLLSTHKNAY